MNITPEDVLEATGDPLTSVTRYDYGGSFTWRVGWMLKTQRMAASVEVSKAYIKQAVHGKVPVVLELRALIKATNEHDEFAVDVLTGRATKRSEVW